MLFLTDMNLNTHRKLLIMLVSMIGISALLIFVPPLASVSDDDVLTEQTESGKSPHGLQPHELFYLDRNYPDFNIRPGIYQERLQKMKAFDQISIRSKRGLDFPWTIEGPGNIGGRVNAIAVHPIDPNIILLGYSQGGMYRTDDGGQVWIPVFDDQASLAISHITFDSFDPDVIWATTGDVNISGYPFLGSGIYKSEDGGLTWNYVGLDQTGVLSKVVVDPKNANILYVGSMGYPSHKGPERGLFRSANGGLTWQKTLTIDDSTGVIDLVCDPLQAGRVFASGWTSLRRRRATSSDWPRSIRRRRTNPSSGLPNANFAAANLPRPQHGSSVRSPIIPIVRCWRRCASIEPSLFREPKRNPRRQLRWVIFASGFRITNSKPMRCICRQ
jgi:hypothetical protein